MVGKAGVSAMKYGGRIELIFGPMFSGKSSELMRRIRRYTIAQQDCVVFKWATDNRYGTQDKMSTHDRQHLDAIPCESLAAMETKALRYDCIGIDEGQFFPDVVPFCERMANHGKVVIVAALDGTYQRKPFNSVLDLVPMAESVTKLNAVCMICCKDAAFSRRIDDNVHELRVIGGADKYVAVCRECFHRDMKLKPAEDSVDAAKANINTLREVKENGVISVS